MPSKETRELDLVFREVCIQSNNFGMKLVQTRDKLKPFCDEGVVHKDRKRCNKNDKEAGDDEDKKRDVVVEKRIWEYKERIKELITDTDIYGLTKLLKEVTEDLDDDPHIDYIQKKLRLEIIHCQLCIRENFIWKQKVKETQSNLAKNMFANAIMQDAKE